MNTKALRQKILDLAIHGKLLPLEKVEQIRKDEPASELLEKIRADRTVARACGSAKKGELKKDKNDSFIFVGDDKRHYEKFAYGSVKDIEDEIPFEVPEGWSWCRLGEICDYGKCINISASELKNEDWILDLEDIEKETGKIISIHTFEERKSESTKHKFFKGQVLYSKLRPYLNKVVIAPADGFCTSEILPLDFNNTYLPKFGQIVLMSNFFLGIVNLLTYGVKMPRLGTEDAKKIFLPLPPLTEQKLIVEEIEKIFAQIDLLEQNKTDLQTAIKQAKSKILDLAIHGKLVPQDPNDEPASVLLEKIRAEKEEKIAKGEIKRDKNDSFIYKSTTDNCHYEKLNGKDVCIEDELPFSIPENWQWCRLKKVCSNFIVPQRDKPKVFNGTIPWCRIEDIEGKYLNGSLSNQLVTEETIKEMNMHICPAGSVICSCSASIGVQAITTVACCTNQTFIGIVPIIFMLFTEYLFYFLKAQTKYFHEIATGTTIKYISREKFEELFIPLPPLSEQKRIVAKIEELFSLLDQIQTNIV